jgi:hypothetical protein
VKRRGSLALRVARVWRTLPRERRLAALAGAAFILILFLPWYQRQYFTLVGGRPVGAADTQSGWQAFSFVEAAVLLVAAGVLTLLFQRGEGRAFHLPGGDGWIITAAGAWTVALIVWRMFDKQGATTQAQHVVNYGIEWGIFAALADAALLAYAGSRIRAAHAPEPPLPGERAPAAWGPSSWEPAPARPRQSRRRSTAASATGATLVTEPIEIADPPEPPELRPRPRRLTPQPAARPPAPEDQLTIPFDKPGG